MSLYSPKGPFSIKLHDPTWVKKRYSIFLRDNFRCVNCGFRRKIEVHHRQYHFSNLRNNYLDPWEYDNTLLITLCKRCNNAGRRKYVIPIIFIN